MYNRYISNDRGTYVPIPEDGPSSLHPPSPNGNPAAEVPPPHKRGFHSLEGLKELWGSLTDRLHLDAGDLLLLVMLYFLYREDADEEVLLALALLLIL